MARDRKLPSDFWTWEAVIDCAAMTRLLFLGLWNFADSFGVQPLRPRTIRLQVFPGDPIDEAQVRAMIDELVARGLLRIYVADEAEYLEIVDWRQIQRVGKRARRRYPGDPSRPDPVPEPAAEPPPMPVVAAPLDAVPGVSPVAAQWRTVIGRSLRRMLPNGPPGDTEQWIDHWIAEGYDLAADVLPAINLACRPSPDLGAPLGLAAAAAYAEANRARRLACAPPGT
jgi:hypothetical protein